VAHKVYPPDQRVREFLGHWIHSLAAVGKTPLLTTTSQAQENNEMVGFAVIV